MANEKKMWACPSMTRVGLSQLTSRPFVEVLETRAGEFKQIAQSLTQQPIIFSLLFG